MNANRTERRRGLDALLLIVAAAALAGAVALAVTTQNPSRPAPAATAQPAKAPLARAEAGRPRPATPIPTTVNPEVIPDLGDTPLFVAFEGDPRAGQRTVMGAASGGPGTACFSCHGLTGEGDSASGFPRLAGQPAYYLYRQLTGFADGSRPDDIMSPIAAQMTEQERRDAAAYYAAARAPFRPLPPGDPKLLQLGGRLAISGSQARGVQSCVGCHGPDGVGVPPDTPYLAGQDAAYMEAQLKHWGEGRRHTDPLGVMADVARRLSPQERQWVVRYFAALPPPAS